mmetsp:Transcript_17271/g.41601  ORF Transcript_17271/g.41601 Transcript_17271/m.41601 type:complete len:294 (-) Transcript_17271:161-1042(-)
MGGWELALDVERIVRMSPGTLFFDSLEALLLAAVVGGKETPIRDFLDPRSRDHKVDAIVLSVDGVVARLVQREVDQLLGDEAVICDREVKLVVPHSIHLVEEVGGPDPLVELLLFSHREEGDEVGVAVPVSRPRERYHHRLHAIDGRVEVLQEDLDLSAEEEVSRRPGAEVAEAFGGWSILERLQKLMEHLLVRFCCIVGRLLELDEVKLQESVLRHDPVVGERVRLVVEGGVAPRALGHRAQAAHAVAVVGVDRVGQLRLRVLHLAEAEADITLGLLGEFEAVVSRGVRLGE